MNNIKKAICLQSSKQYFEQTIHAITSAKKHNPEYEVVLLSDGVDSDLIDYHVKIEDLNIDKNVINHTTGHPLWLVTGRPAIIRYTLNNLNFDSCIFLDGDTYTYNSYEKLQNIIDNGASVVVTPHLLSPLPNDNKSPPINDICLMGNYNSGVLGVSKLGLKFINWWEKQTKLFPYIQKEIGIAAEQGWLRFAADFDENTKVFRDKGYNVAYWNIAERNINYKDDIFYADNDRLCIMHYSGMNKNTPAETMSRYQNRYLLKQDGLTYKLFNDYKKLVWG